MFIRNLGEKIDLSLENLGILSFIIFFIFSPLTVKVKLAEGVFVEPLLVFLFLSVVFLSWYQLRGRSVSEVVLAGKDFLLRNKISLFFVLLMTALFLSHFYGLALTGIDSTGDFLRLIKYSLYFLAFPLAIFSGRRLQNRRVKIVLSLVVVVGVITSLISLFRISSFLASGGEIDFWIYSPETRSTGMLARYFDPVELRIGNIAKAAHATFGLYLSAALVSCLALLSGVREFSKKWILLLGAVGIIFTALLYTISRGALGTGVFVLLSWFVFLFKQKKFWVIALTSVFIAVLGLGAVRLNSEVSRKFATTVKVSKVSVDEGGSGSDASSSKSSAGNNVSGDQGSGSKIDVDLDASFSGRIRMWKDIIDLFVSRPEFALFGVGYSTENLIHFTEGKVVYAHSLFMDMWVRGGLLNLGLMLILWFYLFKFSFRFLFSEDRFVRAFGFAVLGFLVGWFGDNLISGEQFFSDAPMLAFWGSFGLIYSLWSEEGSEDEIVQK